MKKVTVSLLVIILLLCCGCNKSTVTTNTDSWIEEGNNNKESTNLESNSDSDLTSNSNQDSYSDTNSNTKIDNPLNVDLKGATIKIYQGSASFSSFVVSNPSTKTLKSYSEILNNIQKKLNCKFEVVNVTEDKLKSQVMASAASGKALCNIITSRMYDVISLQVFWRI